jgi:hypothetical protein
VFQQLGSIPMGKSGKEVHRCQPQMWNQPFGLVSTQGCPKTPGTKCNRMGSLSQGERETLK